jgi:hypothetical protein
MRSFEYGAFDPETVALLKSVLDDAWASLDQEQRAHWTPNELAKRIVKLARRGERDPARLRMFALTEAVSPRRVAGANDRGVRERGKTVPPLLAK